MEEDGGRKGEHGPAESLGLGDGDELFALGILQVRRREYGDGKLKKGRREGAEGSSS